MNIDPGFMGKNGFYWFMGVVEDRDDPQKLGRCRLRILGWHTDDKLQIPTDSLPWATPMQPITSAGNSGIGTTPLGPVEGTWVIGFFRDGEEGQDPVMMGTVGGLNTLPANPSYGFNDPSGAYPDATYIGAPDTNKLAVNSAVFPHPVIASRAAEVVTTGLITSADGTTWVEPSALNASLYPYNHVRESASGHIEEWDDTPTQERLHRRHKSGTYEEITVDGDRVIKIIRDGYEIILGDEYAYVKGDVHLTVNGACNLKAGSVKQVVTGDYSLDAATVNITASGAMNLEAVGINTIKGSIVDLNP